MKFKGLTKLAMSGVALAAVAATLGTSTYAWYVTNSTATASNIEAKTRASDGSNLLVSKDGSNFSSKVVFNTATAGDYVKNGTLDPVTTTDLATFIEYGEDGVSTSAVTTKTVEIKYYLKSSADVTVLTTLTATNTTTALAAQKTYYTAGGVTGNSTVKIDAMHALRTAFIVKNYETASATSATTTNYVYETEKIASSYAFHADETLSVATQSTVKIDNAAGEEVDYTAKGAHAYYAAVMRHAPGSTADSYATVSAATSIDTLTLFADKAAEITMIIWLEGGDDMCFDACGGQSFTFNLEFTKTN